MRGAAFESAQVDDALVGAAAELEGDVLLRLEERSVDENVRERQHLVRHLGAPARLGLKVGLEDASGVYPQRLRVAELLAEAPEERHQRALVLGLHRLAAEQGEPVDEVGLEGGEDLVLRLLRERLAVGEVPRRLVEAPLAVVRATRDEEGDPHSLSVRDVAGSYRRVVHDTCRTRSLISCVRPWFQNWEPM